VVGVQAGTPEMGTEKEIGERKPPRQANANVAVLASI
jgi:hypothetical protein